MHQTHFTPGPSKLYYTVEGHIKNALKSQVPSISHRSGQFEKIYAHAVSQLRVLMNIPEHFEVLFTSSATEIWERIIQNCVKNSSFHLVNGAFSKRFYQISGQLGRNAMVAEVAPGQCVDTSALAIPDSAELIAITQNETSTGVAQPLDDIYTFKDEHPDKLLVVDAVSAVPYVDIDFNKIDSLFFSVQKGFGLPAGLGVWILNDKCIEKAESMLKQGLSIGSYHSIPSFLSKSGRHQTPETPNILGIYLLGKVAEDMLQKGITQIRRETEYKAALAYNLLENHSLMEPFVANPDHRSKTVIVAKTAIDSKKIIDKAGENGMIIGSGYGQFKNEHIRVANFPTHSKEQFEMLVDFLSEYSPQ